MSELEKDKSTERFYKISYFLIPVPMIAFAIIATYMSTTADTHIDTFCTISTQASDYKKEPLHREDFKLLEEMTLDYCKQNDDNIDGSDGRAKGRVRWFECHGTSCGPGWQNYLVEK